MYTLLRNEILTLDKLTGNLIKTFICYNAATAAIATLPCLGDPQPSNLRDTKAKLRIILHLQNKQTRTQILSWSKGKKGIGSHRSNARVFLVLDSVVLTEYSSLLTSINYEEIERFYKIVMGRIRLTTSTTQKCVLKSIMVYFEVAFWIWLNIQHTCSTHDSSKHVKSCGILGRILFGRMKHERSLTKEQQTVTCLWKDCFQD